MKKIISRSELQNVINSLANISTRIIKNNPEISYAEFKQEVIKKSPFFLSQQQLDRDNVVLEKKELLAKFKFILKSRSLDKHLKKLLMIHSESTPVCKLDCSNMRISIIGAGLAGLLSAYLLARHGAAVSLYEARSIDSFNLRPQNISFKEAEIYLKNLLEKKIYKQFFQHGAALDSENKLRITIGTFQQVLLTNLKKLNVKIHYNTAVSLKKIESFKKTDFVLIAAGAHACQRLKLQSHFQQEVFDQYETKGKTALFVKPSLESSGYLGDEREGEDWWRKNKSVFSGKVLSQDIDRLIKILSNKKNNVSKIKNLEKLKSNKAVEYTFIFGHHTCDFLKLNMGVDPILKTTYRVIPTIVCNPFGDYDKKPIILIGDSNGSPHPLAAIGTLKIVKEANELIKLIASYNEIYYLKRLNIISENQINHLLYEINNVYALSVMEAIKAVFYANILSFFFSTRNVILPKKWTLN